MQVVRDGRSTRDSAIEAGVQTMRKVFTKMGYAVFCLGTELSHKEVVDGIKAIASTAIPTSYRRCFFYACAHGFEDGIHALDGDVMLSEITEPLLHSEHLQSIPIVFFLDSCRDPSPLSSTCRPDIPRGNSMLVRATFRYCPTIADHECGLFTYALARVLPTARDTLLNLLNKEVPEEMMRKLKDHADYVLLPDEFDRLRPTVLYSEVEEIRLVEEKENLGKILIVARAY